MSGCYEVETEKRSTLHSLTADCLRALAKNLKARLTGASSKRDIIERLVALSKVGCFPVSNEGDHAWPGLSYLTDEKAAILAGMPKYEDITEWTKSLGCVRQFHFVNLFVYLVESCDKTFDHESRGQLGH